MIIKRLDEEAIRPYSKEQQLFRAKKENPKRNAKVIREFKNKYPSCIICGKKANAAHIKSKAAGGSNKENNLIALLRRNMVKRRRGRRCINKIFKERG